MNSFKVLTIFCLSLITQSSYVLYASNLIVNGINDTAILASLQTHFSAHPNEGEFTFSDVRSLRNSTINTLAVNHGFTAHQQEVLFKIQGKLSENLQEKLSQRRYVASSWLDKIGFISISTSGFIFNIAGGLVVEDKIIKSLFYIGAAINGLGTLIQLPPIHNAILKPRSGNLLPSWYDEKEIAIQSQLISLVSIVFNSRNVLNLDNQKSWSKRLITQSHISDHADELKEYILSIYRPGPSALISYINPNRANALNTLQFPRI